MVSFQIPTVIVIFSGSGASSSSQTESWVSDSSQSDNNNNNDGSNSSENDNSFSYGNNNSNLQNENKYQINNNYQNNNSNLPNENNNNSYSDMCNLNNTSEMLDFGLKPDADSTNLDPKLTNLETATRLVISGDEADFLQNSDSAVKPELEDWISMLNAEFETDSRPRVKVEEVVNDVTPVERVIVEQIFENPTDLFVSNDLPSFLGYIIVRIAIKRAHRKATP